jgi:hypothetical protein
MIDDPNTCLEQVFRRARCAAVAPNTTSSLPGEWAARLLERSSTRFSSQ